METATLVPEIHMNFTFNVARESGAVLYGGALQFCRVEVNGRQVEVETFDFIRDILTVIPEGDNSSLSSDPLRACFCTANNTIDCSMRQLSIVTKRGQVFQLPVISAQQASSTRL